MFHHEWVLAAPPAAVFAVLADVARYPNWWPQVRSADPYDEDSGHARIRSVLPVPLHLEITREVQDERRGVLRVHLGRDLLGWSQWSIGPAGPGCRARFDQRVVIADSAGWPLRAAGAAGRPGRAVLTANHAWMMRAGERGLRRHLARGGAGAAGGAAGPART